MSILPQYYKGWHIAVLLLRVAVLCARMFWDGAVATGYTGSLLFTFGIIGLICVTFVVDHPYTSLAFVSLWMIIAIAETIARRG